MSTETNSSPYPALISVSRHDDIPPVTYINEDKFLIGRGYESHFKILEKAISRRHCSLEKSSSNEWKILSLSRNIMEINSTPLYTDQSKLLKCGDRIHFVGVCSFVFKCKPDGNNKCCSDRPQTDIMVVDLENEAIPENRDYLNTSISLLSPEDGSSISLLSPINSPANPPAPVIPCVTIVDETSTPNTTPIEVDESTSLPKLSDILEQVEKYMSEKNDLNNSDEKSIIILKKETKYLKQLQELNDHLSKNMALVSKKAPSPTMKKLMNITKEDRCKRDSIDLPESKDIRLRDISGKVNMLLKEEKKRFSLLLLELYEHTVSSAEGSSHSDDEEEIPVVDSVFRTADIMASKLADYEKDLKDELKTYQQNSEWQEARIQYLEMKLKERDKLEKQLESAKEETESLQTQVRDMRTKMSKMEVLELELMCLKERSKYQEDDKRSKDELENQIQSLKVNLQESREEVKTVAMAKSLLEDELSSLKQKSEELEKKLNVKVGCSSNAVTGEYCCDLFNSLKDNVLEALEKEFTCCICNEMFVGATVTNCNHVFCTYCLKEWKKKKKQCPFCRAALTSEHRAKVIDECITNVVKCVSDRIFAERMQMIEDRKNTGTPPAPKRVRRSRAQEPSVALPLPLRNTFPYGHQGFIVNLP